MFDSQNRNICTAICNAEQNCSSSVSWGIANSVKWMLLTFYFCQRSKGGHRTLIFNSVGEGKKSSECGYKLKKQGAAETFHVFLGVFVWHHCYLISELWHWIVRVCGSHKPQSC